MTVCENGASVNQAKENDPRVTKLGRFFRAEHRWMSYRNSLTY